MRIALTFLIPVLFLLGCSNESSQPVAWEDKTPEQQQKEYKYWSSCHAKHYETKNFDACYEEFEKEFGYPYKGSGSKYK